MPVDLKDTEGSMARSLLVLREREVGQAVGLLEAALAGDDFRVEALAWLEGRKGSTPDLTPRAEPIDELVMVRHKGAWQPTALDPSSFASMEFGRAVIYPMGGSDA